MYARDLRPAGAGQFPCPRIPADALKLAVIIPALNESQALAHLLADLDIQAGVTFEVIVVDGGSDDETVAVAKSQGAHVVEAPRGRGAQMNAGRAHTDAGWLLFLHADTRLPDRRTLERGLTAVRAAPRQCGHFKLRFRGADPRLRFLEAKSALSRPYTTNGDQGMLVEAAMFDELGGFDDSLPFIEDQRFGEKVRDAGGIWVTLPNVITTSPRRFETEGFRQRYFGMALIMAAWAGGAHEFFDAAPQAYRAKPASRLDVESLLTAIRIANRQMGLRRRLSTWLRVGSFARSNAWQLFYAADVALADELDDGDHPFLDLYDRRVARCIDNRILDGAIAATAFVMFTRLIPAALRLNAARTA